MRAARRSSPSSLAWTRTAATTCRVEVCVTGLLALMHAYAERQAACYVCDPHLLERAHHAVRHTGHKEALARCMRLAVAKASPSGKHKPTINFHLQKVRHATRRPPLLPPSHARHDGPPPVCFLSL